MKMVNVQIPVDDLHLVMWSIRRRQDELRRAIKQDIPEKESFQDIHTKLEVAKSYFTNALY